MSLDDPPDVAFCRALPKVELHAHLTGSITKPILQRIWDIRSKEPGFDVESPDTALIDGAGQDIGAFFGHFNTYLYKLVSDVPSLLLATQSVLEAFQNDGVGYFELRTTPRRIGGCDEEETIRAICGVISAWNEKETMRTNLILSIDQAKHTTEQAIRIVDLATTLRDEGMPVVGVDLCGDPHRTADMTIFRLAFKLAKERGLGITLHFAEVPHSSSPEVLEEMLSWQPNRLGHVIHVSPALRQVIIAREISVELCLTCNVLAGMLPDKASYEQHHFQEWWKGGARVSLGTDDVGVFGSMPSEEYLIAATHFGLSRRDLVGLSLGALTGAFGETGGVQKKLQALC